MGNCFKVLSFICNLFFFTISCQQPDYVYMESVGLYFVTESELNDTIVEAQLRIRQIPPVLQTEEAVGRYLDSNNRLLILGFNATLTEPVECDRRVDQFKEMEPRLHREAKEALKRLCEDPKTTVVVLSGCHHSILDKNFGEFSIWLGAEHGVFLRTPNKKWIRNLPDVHMDWVDSVKHVFEYFTERTPQSCFEVRETSLVWNYKHAGCYDIEFGRLQAKDMLQHLWTGPISNASVEVVQGGRSVEVRANGVTKGAGIKRILGQVIHYNDMKEPIDYILCVGHFLPKDEDVYTFFEPEPPTPVRSSLSSPVNGLSLDRNGSGGLSIRKANPFSASDSNDDITSNGDGYVNSTAPSILDLNSNHYFSCAVKTKRSSARYLLNSLADVVSLLKRMSDMSLAS